MPITFFFYTLLATGLVLGLFFSRKKILLIIEERLKETYSPIYLASFRILLAGLVIWRMGEIYTLPFPPTEPLLLARLLPGLFSILTKAPIYNSLLFTIILLAVFFAAGIRTRIAAPLLFFGFTLTETIALGFGKIEHIHQIVALLLLGISLHSFLRIKSAGISRASFFLIAYFFVGIVYFMSSVAKMADPVSMLAWISGETMQNAILMNTIHSFVRDGHLPPLISFVLYAKPLLPLVSVGILALEGAALLLPLLEKEVRAIIFFLLFLLHASIASILGIYFVPHMLIALFLNWDWPTFFGLQKNKEI